MNIFKLFLLVTGFAAGVACAIVGSEQGLGGGIVGGLFGAFGGVVLASLVLLVLFAIDAVVGRVVGRALLRPIFGRYWRRRDLWESVVERFVSGSLVQGEVVLHRPWGVVIDVGCGFPALLRVGDMQERRQGRGLEGYPVLGETVEARVLERSPWGSELVLVEAPAPRSVLAGEPDVSVTPRLDVRVQIRASEIESALRGSRAAV